MFQLEHSAQCSDRNIRQESYRMVSSISEIQSGRFNTSRRLGSIGGAHDAVLLHQIDQVRGAAVADAQPPLQQGSGRLAKLNHQPHRILIQRIVFVPVLRSVAPRRPLPGSRSSFGASRNCC